MGAHVYAFALAGVCVVCGTVLAAMGHPVPDFLPLIASASLGGAAGLALPGQSQAPQPEAQPSPLIRSGGL